MKRKIDNNLLTVNLQYIPVELTLNKDLMTINYLKVKKLGSCCDYLRRHILDL